MQYIFWTVLDSFYTGASTVSLCASPGMISESFSFVGGSPTLTKECPSLGFRPHTELPKWGPLLAPAFAAAIALVPHDSKSVSFANLSAWLFEVLQLEIKAICDESANGIRHVAGWIARLTTSYSAVLTNDGLPHVLSGSWTRRLAETSRQLPSVSPPLGYTRPG